MFTIIRLIIGCLLFACSIPIIIKSKATKKTNQYIISAAVVITLTVASMFLPIENLFVTFDSPRSSYGYTKSGEKDIVLVVEGQNSDLVVGEENNADIYLIIPKIEDGWKIGLGINTKLTTQKVVDGIIVSVYRYKDTGDYYVTVFDTAGGHEEITDSENSNFLHLEKYDDALDKTFVTYYAHVYDLDSQYWISINGEKIALA